MQSTIIKFIVSCLVIFALTKLLNRGKRKPEPPSSSRLLIEKMKTMGANLEELKLVDFTFFFPTRELAEKAAQALREWDYSPQITESGDTVLVQFEKSLIIDEATMLVLDEMFERLARQYSGEYDGWGAEI